MAEYIEREALLAEYERLHTGEPGRARKLIAEAPAADVVEVKHGWWVKDGDFLICLNCESEINIKNSLGVENRKNYCPNCGARMDGE